MHLTEWKLHFIVRCTVSSLFIFYHPQLLNFQTITEPLAISPNFYYPIRAIMFSLHPLKYLRNARLSDCMQLRTIKIDMTDSISPIIKSHTRSTWHTKILETSTTILFSKLPSAALSTIGVRSVPWVFFCSPKMTFYICFDHISSTENL